ncbi:MAG: hypothetical protein GF329_22120 [Candidatus Lokiarchaeota archaeon]|nr:hypothetical protein [Candidatus Lokiarchaeota archaeon]
MVKERVGLLFKLFAHIGKRLYYKKQSKLNFLLLICIVKAVVKEYTRLNNGDIEEALKILGDTVKRETAVVVLDLIDKPVLLGIKMAIMLSKDIRDIPFDLKLAFWSILGKRASKVFEDPVLILAEDAEDNIAKIKIGMKICPFCPEDLSETDITPEDLGDEDFAIVMTALGEAAVQNIEDYVGNSYNIICRETKCRLKGDEKGELTIYFYPKEEQ